ncbi:TRAP transporter small permease [Marinomonas spartinae]|uniref:TRAP transporter small permease n=1 Tax=Marinomonas spartinae TaxID=1792290 RepID=UPI0018F1C50D|nr:TRAP transporter small permease subunit [Marinomonas spartinae]MBJ7552830.1 TRAP transporter small permease subunit [Marinomonas spartinae]
MEQVFKYVLTILISIVAASQFVQVVTRYVLQTPVMGLEEIVLIPTIWLYILGSVNASREDTQIRANVLEIFLKTDRAKLVLHIISDFLSIMVSLWLTWWAWRYFAYSIRIWKETPTLYIPTFTYESSLFIGLSLMTLFTISHLYKNTLKLIKNQNPPNNSSSISSLSMTKKDH